MTNRKMTIKDVAKLAGVSPTAVSFVLNDREGIGDATREKIRAVIKEIDYYPSAASQRLTMHKSFNVAFLYPSSASPFADLFYYEVADGLTKELTQNRYNVVFAPFECGGGNYDLPQIIKRQDADGAVILQSAPPAMLDELEGLELPYVLIDWQSEAPGRVGISFDCEQSIYRAVMYLVEKGHQRIAFWGSDALPYYYLRCFSGYQCALSEAKLPISPGWIVTNIYDANSANTCIQKFLSMEERPTAVCCMSDMCAINSIQAAEKAGVKIPEDLSFISIDDILLSRYLSPQLTTIAYHKKKIGKTAAHLLLEQIAGNKVDGVIVNSDDIIERESVADLSKTKEGEI